MQEVLSGAPLEEVPVEQFFPQTQHRMQLGFLRFWFTRGGLPVFGFPLDEEHHDASGMAIQHTERARFERPLGQAPDTQKVQLGRVGFERAQQLGHLDAGGRPVHPAFRTVPDPGDGSWFPEVGHTLRRGFRAYWERVGGLEIFGFPLSEEFVESGVTVQYFERARFERRRSQPPEQADVSLGRVAAELIGA